MFNNSPSLYIHIPFCDSKCSYCSFNSYTDKHDLKERYITSLLQQLDFEIERFKVDNFSSIYIGGGTPSTLKISQVERIFRKISPFLKSNIEITIEANPNSADEVWLREVRNLGVNRLSLGVQSFDREKLKFLGRSHSPESALKSVENGRKAGFSRINIDLIYNTSFDNRELLERDMKIVDNLEIDHLSLYSLILEDGTPFQSREDFLKENLEDTEWLFRRVGERFTQYEISNFGNPSKHNLSYWKGANYLGVGSGAVGFLDDRRLYPNRNLEEYIENPLKIDEEILTDSDLHFEKLFLGFRSKIGVSKEILTSSEIEICELLKSEKILEFRNNRYFNKNYLLADEVALRVIS
jgi:oxygen-independent coproporphyrinogen-3 oxidase